MRNVRAGSDRVLPNVEEPASINGSRLQRGRPALVAINRHLSGPDRALAQPPALGPGLALRKACGPQHAHSPQERLGIFIDGADLLAASQSLGFCVDFKRLLSLFRRQAKLMRYVFYAALTEDDRGECPMRPLVDWLQYNGYTTVTKTMRRGFAGQALPSGAMDVELAVDAMRLGRALDHLILFSGRVELKALVAALQEEGKRVTIVSTLANRDACSR